MAAGRHIEIYNKLNNSRNVSPNLGQRFDLTPARHRTGRIGHLSKFKMAADEKLKFTKKLNNFETIRPIEPNFAFSINSPLGTRLWFHNHENRNPRWPMTAILKFRIFFNKTANINVNNYNGRCCESRQKGNRARSARKWGSGGTLGTLLPS